MTLVTRKAPDFTSAAVLGSGEIVEDFNLAKHINGKYAVVFFWPMDFTFVCPSEIIAFDHRLEEYVHNAWRNTPQDKGGIGEVKFPIVADIKHSIMQAYGVEHPEAGVALRASFFIDKSGVVRHETINDLPIGRNIDEMIRIVDAFQFHEEHGEVCPAQWTKGKQGMQANPNGVASYLKQHGNEI